MPKAISKSITKLRRDVGHKSSILCNISNDRLYSAAGGILVGIVQRFIDLIEITFISWSVANIGNKFEQNPTETKQWKFQPITLRLSFRLQAQQPVCVQFPRYKSLTPPPFQLHEFKMIFRISAWSRNCNTCRKLYHTHYYQWLHSCLVLLTVTPLQNYLR